MKLVMTLLVRDEEDIVAANIDFHLAQGVDFIIAMDNLSVDRTPEILREYERRGVLLTISQTGDDYMQFRWVTEMARMASKHSGADWVINSDADEFWYPERGNLKDILGAVASNVDAVKVERTNFLPRTIEDGAFFADVMTTRERVSLNPLGNPLPCKVCHRALAAIEVEQGSHSVRLSGRPLPTANVAITILHFPIRSYRQFANKIALGGAAYERNTELDPRVGVTWRELYKIWKKGELEAYYQKLMLSEAEIERGETEGRFIRDYRLRDFLGKGTFLNLTGEASGYR